MKKNIAKILSFALALTLMTSAFPMVAEAAHIHDYEVINETLKHEWINNNEHSVIEYHTHRCSCGDVYTEHHIVGSESHSPAMGSEVYEGSYLDGDTNYDTYRYTCVKCNHTYRRSVASIHHLAVEEEAE